MIFWVMRGKRPSIPEKNVINALLVASVDHGPFSPSTVAVRNAASTGAPTNAALSSGLLAMNQFHGGATEYAMQNFLAIESMMGIERISARCAARRFAKKRLKQGKRIEGFGHRVHTDDPRVKKLFSVARKNNAAGFFCSLAKETQRALASEKVFLTINIAGITAALLLDLGFSVMGANLFFMLGRLPGLTAHMIEEKSHHKIMRFVTSPSQKSKRIRRRKDFYGRARKRN
jgi:citrate synthase